MKKSIAVRIGLSVCATMFTLATNALIAPVSTLISSNAALGQMANSDSGYVSSITGMNIGAMLGGAPGIILLVALLAIWGSLLFKNKN